MLLPLIVWILLAMLLLISAFQLLYVWNFWQFLQRPRQYRLAAEIPAAESGDHRQVAGDEIPVAVLLCVRGWDPTLERCLAGLAQQTHPNYCVLCIVDHPQDPALEAVRQWTDNDDRFQLVVSENPPTDRGLKCNSLLIGSAEVRSRYPVIALVDADVDVDPQWLADLVAPFADPQIGLVSGNRWFLPADGRCGTLVRSIWNAAALPQMMAYRIPWGGSLAMRVAAAEQAGVFERWQKTAFDDVLLGPAIEKAGFRIIQSPALMMGNDESCSLTSARRWMVRQLLDTRLYHWSWNVVAAHGINSFAVFVFSLVVLGMQIFSGNFWGMVTVSVAVGLFWLQNALLLKMMEQRVVAKVEARKKNPQARFGWANLCWLMPLVQAVHFWATLEAALTQRLHWRGITYRLKGPDKIEMLGYHPMPGTQQRSESDSI